MTPTPKFQVNQYVCAESLSTPDTKLYIFGHVSKIIMHNCNMGQTWYIGYKVVWSSTGLESEISESELKAAGPVPQETPEMDSVNHGSTPQPKRIETSDLKALGFKLSDASPNNPRFIGKVPNTSRFVFVEPLFDGYVRVSYGDMIKDTNDIDIVKRFINFLHEFQTVAS